jgi:rubredoxin
MSGQQAWRCGSCGLEMSGLAEDPPDDPCETCEGTTWERVMRGEERTGDHLRPGT